MPGHLFKRVMVKKILAVDDDPGTREFYKLAFEEAGFTVETAGDATAAIMVCGDFAPDMLLLDWDMPGGGGKRVLEKICELLGKTIPVLFVTGSPSRVNVDLRSGRISVLKKPVGIEALLSQTDYLLK